LSILAGLDCALPCEFAVPDHHRQQNQQAATEKYQTYPMRIIKFKNPGEHTITVSLIEGDPATSSLESVLIRPID
jgi:hypothetical protein